MTKVWINYGHVIESIWNLSEIGGQFHFPGLSQRPQKTGVPHEQIQAADGN